MHPSIIVPGSLVFAALVGIALAIPMLKNKVPRNKFYGFRTKRTLASDAVWYPANRFAAKGLIIWGVLNLLIGAGSFWFLPLSQTAEFLLIIPPLSVVIPCMISDRWVRKKFKNFEAADVLNPVRSAGAPMPSDSEGR